MPFVARKKHGSMMKFVGRKHMSGSVAHRAATKTALGSVAQSMTSMPMSSMPEKEAMNMDMMKATGSERLSKKQKM